ncbi:MAG: TonB-dependent receptor [Capnocytophaga sp.]|nr:TonB-dependent receptor [Capnocytophaga sp.]
MNKFITALFCAMAPIYIYAQQYTMGQVTDDENLPLPGVNVYWENTSIGVTTDDEGNFSIRHTDQSNVLVFSYVGFKNQKKTITSDAFLNVSLLPEGSLDEVVVTQNRQATVRSKYQVANLQIMSSKELLKAACCNLSESFSTNPSIDVNFSDAVTGNRQIRMLGLTSPYILMAEENIPAIRGASQAYGLSFVPGTWIESIQITKGMGSVINGYESISGQINYEVLKPATDIPFYLNLYGADDSRYEINAHLNHKFSDKLSSTLFAHGNVRNERNDHNNDGFIDNPLGNQLNLLNRWQYVDAEKGWVGFLNLQYMKDERQAGEMRFDPMTDKFTTNAWGSEINTEKISVANKIGYVFPETPYKSFGFQNSFQSHRQNSYFGFNQYDIHQTGFYSNLIYNSIISNTKNKFATGLNFVYDDYNETVAVNFSEDFSRIDRSLGAFFEYTYDNLDNFSLVAGMRADTHNRLGTFITPRLHLRYNPWDGAVLRASAGRGKRAANIFAENQQLFASSRQFSIVNAGGKLYGLDPEIAWNYGGSFLQSFKIFGMDAEVALDFYRTQFDNQIVVDLDQSAQQVVFYNLDGQSFANSFQAELTLTPVKHLDLKAAYKYYDVKTQYAAGLLEKPLTPKHRFFANAAYETHTKNDRLWKFDVTYNWLGEQRFPTTATNPTQYQLGDYAPAFGVVNAQVTRVFSKTFEVYIGGENISNYKQHGGILAANDPFGAYFDSTMLYGPVFGRMFYAGLRFKILN